MTHIFARSPCAKTYKDSASYSLRTTQMNMWFFVMLVAFGSRQSKAQNSTTYQHLDISTGQTLTCSRCEPGYYLVEHCSATQPTNCARCEDGLYTECWNYVRDCLICDTCVENQVISQPCSPSQNTKCLCKEGYFWNSYYCKRHAVCPLGHGLKTKGTPHEDTECEPCLSGFYTAGNPGNATCQRHTSCDGLMTVLKGTTWHDAVCASCDDIHEDGVELLRNILPDFFIYHVKNKKRMQRLVTRAFLSASSKRIVGRRHSIPEDIDFRKSLSDWVSNASAQDIRKLPDRLEKLQIYNAAEKLDRKIARLDEEVKRCNGAINNEIHRQLQ